MWLKDAEGKDLKLGAAAAIAVHDWDQDGRLDLLVALKQGELQYYPGREEHGTFDKGRPILCQGAPIKMMDSAVHAVDWDGDGTDDLLISWGHGKLAFYRGIAQSSGAPLLDIPRTLFEQGITYARFLTPRLAMERECHGNRLRIETYDWNRDGKLDLLVGDSSYPTRDSDLVEPFTSEQQRRYDALNEEVLAVRAKYQAKMKTASARILQELGFESDLLSDQQRALVRERMKLYLEKDPEAVRIAEESDKLMVKLKEFERPSTFGFVWVYLRR